MAHKNDPGARDTQEIEKIDENTTDDLNKQPDQNTTDDLNAEPVKKRFDSSQWITSW